MIQIAKVFPGKKKKSHLVQETKILQNDWRNWKNEGQEKLPLALRKQRGAKLKGTAANICNSNVDNTQEKAQIYL